MSQAPATSPPKSRPEPDQPAMEFRILGSLSVLRSEKPVPLGGPKQRLVLALLVLEANRVISADRLIDRVWGDNPPEAARGTLQAYVSRLRKLLGPDRIEARAPGYVVRTERDEVDSVRFERLVADAHGRLEAEPQVARSLLDVALDLWRGPVLDDLAAELAVQAEISRLTELRLAATGYRIEARMALGHHAELVPELERLVAENPLREPFSASLMLALYRSERQAEALAAFERTRRLVSEDLGVDPSPALRRLHERILKQDPDLAPKGKRVRGYELVERIGEGANGVVYRAVQPTLGRDVAVKVIHRGLANQPEFIRRFEQEAQLVARLEHPHIVPLHDYWRGPEGAYLAMRYVRGGSLKDRLETTGPLTAAEARLLVEQICSALAFAHRQGVVHRDVRPRNILFDEDGNWYLADFGIAIDVAVAGALNRRYGDFAYYLAPEEIRSGLISPATDVYGLGLVLHEALTGRHAFADSPSSEILDRQLTAPTSPIGLARPDLPAAAGAVIMRATAKDPADRYPDASAFAAEFLEALAGGSKHAAVAPLIDRNPYKGLRAFGEADAPDFFGRDQLTSQLVARLRETGRGHRLLAVVGPSGSGKSSAVRAGLIPAMRRGDAPGSEHWFVVEMHPGVQPFRELESALLRVATHHPPSLAEELEWGHRGLVQAVKQILPPDSSELLLVIDQFEELFTLVPDDSRRNAFLDALAGAVSDTESRIRVVITLRADFYDRPLLHPRFGDLLANRTQAVPPMRSEDLERAIARPAESAGVTFESGLIGAIVSDVVDEPGSLPLLQYALAELFDQRTESTLSLAVYRRMGGISGALSRTAEEMYRHLDEAAKKAARQVFLRLVSLGDGGSQDSRRRVLRTELAALDVEQRAVDRVVEMFGTHRFLTFDRDPATRTPTVEVAHEALLSSWRRLREWIDSGRDDLRTYRRFSAGAKEWEAAGRDPSFLLRGSRLAQFEGWSKATNIAMSVLEREYLDATLRAREKEQAEEHVRQKREALLNRRALNRLRAAVAVLLIGMVAAGSLAVLAQQRGVAAEREARIATARQLVAAASASLTVNTDRSLSLALQAVETTRRVDGTVLPEAEQILHAAVQANRVVLAAHGHRAQFDAEGKRLLIVGVNPGQAEVRDAATGKLISSQTAAGQDEPEFDMPLLAFTPDGKRFVAGGNGRVHGVAVYDASTGGFLGPLGQYCCGDVWITPDGKSVFVVQDELCDGGEGFATHVFDISNGRQLNCIRSTGLWAFSSDGTRAMVATGEFEANPGHVGAVYVGNPNAPELGQYFELGGQADVNGAAWSADGSMLATSSPNSVMVWDSRAAGKPLFTLSPPTGRFATLAFGPQPGLLATGMSDGSAVVWQVSRTGAQQVLRLAGHDGEIRSVAFKPDGKRLATGSSDGLVKVWDITPAGGGERVSVAGSGGVDFSRDGHLFATGSEDGHARVYDAATGNQLDDLAAHTTRVEVVHFALDGSGLVSTGADWTVMSEVGGGQAVWKVLHDPVAAASFAMSPDETIVAIPIGYGEVSIVDARTGSQVRSIFPPVYGNVSGFGQAIAFSRDGRLLAVGGGFGYFHLMQPSGALVNSVATNDLSAVVFSPDGRRLVTVDSTVEGGAVRVYDITNFGRLLGTLERHFAVTGVAFSPDGSKIATSETDGTLRLWDSTTFKQLTVIATDAGGTVAFSPDGTRLVYAAKGEAVRVLALGIDDLIKLAQDRVARSQVHD